MFFGKNVDPFPEAVGVCPEGGVAIILFREGFACTATDLKAGRWLRAGNEAIDRVTTREGELKDLIEDLSW